MLTRSSERIFNPMRYTGIRDHNVHWKCVYSKHLWVIYLSFNYTYKKKYKSFNLLPNIRYVCLDPEVRINRHNCLVYSFGIGNDFSFEREAGLFGCDVYAFDDDDLHEGYPVDPFYRLDLLLLAIYNFREHLFDMQFRNIWMETHLGFQRAMNCRIRQVNI